MEDLTKAFMKVLICLNLQEETVKAITQLMWKNTEQMDKLVAFIKENPNVSDSEIIKKALLIAKIEKTKNEELLWERK